MVARLFRVVLLDEGEADGDEKEKIARTEETMKRVCSRSGGWSE